MSYFWIKLETLASHFHLKPEIALEIIPTIEQDFFYLRNVWFMAEVWVLGRDKIFLQLESK